MQARGLKKHMKRLNAPKHWMLDKLGGAFAPKPSSGPHKSRECLPLILIIRNRLKYALTYREVISILMQRHVLVDGKVRTDKTYPAGFMDVVSIPKTNENFRLLYDTKGRFRLHSIRDEEAKVGVHLFSECRMWNSSIFTDRNINCKHCCFDELLSTPKSFCIKEVYLFLNGSGKCFLPVWLSIRACTSVFLALKNLY
nr:40S ribosomal protein S4-1 [Ipomoea batatas]